MPLNTSVPLVSLPPDPFFDIVPGVGQRQATFKFDLIDGVTHQPLGEIHPVKDTVPSLSHDTTRSIKRTINMQLGVADTLAINPLRDRILPSMVLPDGRVFPLGRYMPVDANTTVHTGGDQSNIALADEMFILDQQLSQGFAAQGTGDGPSVSVSVGGNVGNIVRRLLREYTTLTSSIVTPVGSSQIAVQSNYVPLPFDIDIETTPYLTAGAWPAGTTGAQILEDLTTPGDYFSPWFDNDATFRMIRAFDPATQVPQFDYDVHKVVYRDTVAYSNDLLNAANRIVVTSNSGQGGNRDLPLIGLYNVPSIAPHSVANRGFVIADVVDIQVNSSDQANAMARNIGIRKILVERISFATAPDPRHDSYDVIRFQDALWLEIGWTMSLIEGGAMQHVLQKVYSD